MRFQRGIDPKDGMCIGRDAYIKKAIKDSVRECDGGPKMSWEDRLKWSLWKRGIEIIQIEQKLEYPEYYKAERIQIAQDPLIYTFFYKDCNGDEAHIMKAIKFTKKELYEL